MTIETDQNHTRAREQARIENEKNLNNLIKPDGDLVIQTCDQLYQSAQQLLRQASQYDPGCSSCEFTYYFGEKKSQTHHDFQPAFDQIEANFNPRKQTMPVSCFHRVFIENVIRKLVEYDFQGKIEHGIVTIYRDTSTNLLINQIYMKIIFNNREKEAIRKEREYVFNEKIFDIFDKTSQAQRTEVSGIALSGHRTTLTMETSPFGDL